MSKLERSSQLIFTCEHGGNRIPAPYKTFFKSAGKVLKTHRGWDIGILPVAKQISQLLKADLHFSEVSRLLIDLNRSPSHSRAFSEFTSSLPKTEKKEILRLYYEPYRQTVQKKVLALSSSGAVHHFSMHSFTPVLNKEVRSCEIGLLYDPARALEKKLAAKLKKNLQEVFPDFRLRMNYPYQGKMDGFATALRKQLPPQRYSGIEIEINQKLLTGLTPRARDTFSRNLAWAIAATQG